MEKANAKLELTIDSSRDSRILIRESKCYEGRGDIQKLHFKEQNTADDKIEDR